MFRSDNERTVSCEFSCATQYEEDDYGNYLDDDDNIIEVEDNPILSYHIHGITILGRNYNPSIRGTEIKVKQFAEKIENPLKKFADERDEKLNGKTYKVNKTELKDKSWGDVDKTTLRNKVMSAKNKSTLVKDVYLLVESGWEDAPSEHLKYPAMELVKDTFYYNRGALSSALAYAKQENETTVISKVEKLYKKFKLNDKDKEDKMSDIKEKEDVVMAQPHPSRLAGATADFDGDKK